MTRSRATLITLLCEDKRHEQFARRFLIERGVAGRRIRSRIAPHGVGDAKNWVREHYPKEIRAYRERANAINNILMVLTDVDHETVEKRRETLNQACHDAGVEILKAGDRIALALPKWAIETWILALIGENLDETERIQPAHKQRAEREWRTAVQRLAEYCAGVRGPVTIIPSSLWATCQEYERVRHLL